jgi:hypothetical protein
MKTGKNLNVYDGHRKMALFSLTGRNRGFDLHIMKLMLNNDLDDLRSSLHRQKNGMTKDIF